MDPLTILVTAAGAPGAARLLAALRENGERPVRIVGTDINERSAARLLSDRFVVVPRGDDPSFADALVDVAHREGVDLVFPQSSAEVVPVAESRERFGVPVLISELDAVVAAKEKSATARIADELGIPQPVTIEARDAGQFREAARELGYPGRDICMKPLEGKGSRGFRVLSAHIDRRTALLEGRPGDLLPMSVDEAVEILDGGDGFPPMLVMELIEGEELAVDAICRGGRMLLASAKTREAFRAGLAMEFELIDRPDLLRYSQGLVEALGLDWLVNIQFLGDRLLEVNPRVSTIVYQPDVNMPWLTVKLALGEIGADEVAAFQDRIAIGRRATRYHEQVEFGP
jgi:carbamoyl-phosphate synthase large subunit